MGALGMLGAGLMAAGAPNGQGMGDFISAIQNMKANQRYQNQYLLDLAKFQLEQKRLGLDQNADTRAQQTLTDNEKETSRKNSAQDDYRNNVVGTMPVTPGENDTPYIVAPKDGTGLLGNKLTQRQADLLASADFYQSGDSAQAAGLLTPKAPPHHDPIAAMDATGKPVFMQDDGTGNYSTLQGYSPPPKSQTSLTVDPATGQVMFTQGDMGNGFTKNPMMGPSRGGQGGTYVDPKTGKMISTDTNKQTSQDQATIAAIQRLNPMLDTITNTLPQFQHATTRAKSALEGVANNYLGTNFSLPSQLAAGQSALNAIPDPLLKILGVPSTDEGLKTIRGIVEPHYGESPENYKNRVMGALLHFQSYSTQAQDRLAHGMVVQEGNQPQAPQTPQVPIASPQTAPKPTYSPEQLNQMAQEAIAHGADPQAVKLRMQQMSN